MKKDLEDYFLPTKRNNYAPHVLQKAAILGMVVLIVLSFTAANVQSLIWISSNWMISTILPAVIVDMTNDERKTEQLSTLRRSAVLDAAAKLKAEHMAKNQYFAHYSPDGVAPWYWFGQVSYNFVHAGENLAIHFTDSGDVVDAWMDSPSHRENIMNGNYSEIGVGTAEGTYEGYQTVYVVQLFGTPAAVAEAPQVEVEASPALAIDTTQAEEAVLSESVTLTEDVVIHEAEPIVVYTEESQPQEALETETLQFSEEHESTREGTQQIEQTGQTEKAEQVAQADSQPEKESVSAEDAVVITSMESTSYGVALYSDFISTSTGGVPATLQQLNDEESQNVPFFAELATQPHKVLQILYIIIGAFVLGSVLLSIFLEARHQHPVQIAYGAGLLFIIGALYYMHMAITNGALIV